MNPALIIAIAQLAVGLLDKSSTPNSTARNAESIAEDLITIAQNVAKAYQQHVGEPLDPALIKEEPPLDPAS